MGQNITDDQTWQVIAVWRMKVPVKQICDEYGISEHCVREAIKKYRVIGSYRLSLCVG